MSLRIRKLFILTNITKNRAATAKMMMKNKEKSMETKYRFIFKS